MSEPGVKLTILSAISAPGEPMPSQARFEEQGKMTPKFKQIAEKFIAGEFIPIPVVIYDG